GLEQVTIQRFNYPLHFADDREAILAIFDGGAAALAVARFDEATFAAAAADYLQSISPWRNAKGYDIPGEFVVAMGHKTASPQP
ncbi:MAG: hypothetical protein R3245_09305, partial [Kiloniellales bacterium]|nr:hypothetical protein [Kiloniellales bacterium]